MKKILLLMVLLYIIGVHAEKPIDLKVKVINKELLPDDVLMFQVDIFRLGEKREDVYVQYFIKTDNTLRFIESESLAVEKIGSFVRTIELPHYIQEGQNELIVQTTLHDANTVTTTNFNVIKTHEYITLPQKYLWYLGAGGALVIAFFIIFLMRDYKLTLKLTNAYQKIGEEDLQSI